MIACILLSLLLMAGSDPAVPDHAANRRAREEVLRGLDRVDRAVKAGDAAGAFREAEAAEVIARRDLDPFDPDGARARLAAARYRYSAAARNKDRSTCLLEAGEARRAAVDSGNLKAAERWAGVVDELARVVLPEGDLGRERAAVLLGLARAATAGADGRAGEARGLVESALHRAEATLPPGDGDRARARIDLAVIAIRESRISEARGLLSTVVEEAEGRPDADSRAVLEARLVAFQVEPPRPEGPDLKAAATVLASADRLGQPWDPFSIWATRIVSERTWGRWVSEAKRASTAGGADEAAFRAAEARLNGQVRGFRESLIEAGASERTADVGQLDLAQFRLDLQRVGEASTILGTITASGGPGGHPLFVGAYWTLQGLAASERSDFATARDAHDQAFWTYHRARLPQQSFPLNNLGLLLLRQGDYEMAEGHLRDAEAFLSRDPSFQGDIHRPFVLTNLAKCLEWGNKIPEAFQDHQEALKLARSAANRDPFLICACLNNLGINRYLAGEFDAAADYFGEARGVAVEAFGETHPRVAEVDLNRAWIAQASGQPAQAEALFRSALGRFRGDGDDHPRVAEALSDLARALAGLGRNAEAREALDEALGLQERSLTRALRSPLSERDRLAIVQEQRVHPESSAWPGVLDTYLDLAPALGVSPEDQYGRLLAWKAISARHVPPRPSELEDDPEIRRLAADREDRLRRLGDASASRLGNRAVATRGQIAALEAEIESLERTLARRSPRFGRGAVTDRLTPARVAGALPPGSSLVDVIEIRRYRPDDGGELLKDFRYAAFVTRPGLPVARVDFPEPASKVNAAILAFRDDIEKRRDFARSGAELSRMIREPLLPRLEGADLMIVVGDDLLNLLPFAALPGSKPGGYWIEDLAIATLPGASSMVERRARPGSTSEGAVIVGGVDYATWDRLPGTVLEAAEVKRIYAGTHLGGLPADVVSGAGATPERLRALLPSRRFAHLATHGFFQAGGGDGLFKTHGAAARFDSGLVLAGAPDRPGDPPFDDLLSAEEIGGLDLRGLELVVLSACESGLGRIRAGQGVIGLVGALDRAGASSIVSTLWKVSDEGTAAIMSAFYRRYWPGGDPVGPARALRDAQVELIRGAVRSPSGGSYAHPFYWAAFVLVGEPGPAPAR